MVGDLFIKGRVEIVQDFQVFVCFLGQSVQRLRGIVVYYIMSLFIQSNLMILFYVQIIFLNYKYFRNYLEDSFLLGRFLFIEDVGEELDFVLDNVLEKNFIKIGFIFKVCEIY